jgi:hypothetical protein
MQKKERTNERERENKYKSKRVRETARQAIDIDLSRLIDMETEGSGDLALIVRKCHTVLALISGQHNGDFQREFSLGIGEDKATRFAVQRFAIDIPLR